MSRGGEDAQGEPELEFWPCQTHERGYPGLVTGPR
jgi:hypothetical protein